MLTKEKAKLIKKFSLSEIQELESQRNILELDHRSADESLTFLGTRITTLKDRIGKYSGKGLCDHCGERSLAVEELLLESQSALKGLYEDRNTLRKKVKKLEKEIDEAFIPIPSSDFEFFETLNNVDVEVKVLKSQLTSQKRLAKKHSEEMMRTQKEYDLMRFWELAFSEQGLVKYIIRHILDYFNKMSNFYLATLTKGTFTISFDELLEEAIETKKGKVFFESLSGGEKKKVALSVMLALNDLLVLSGKERSNIMFFDEVADSLDREGVKGLCDLIERLTEKKKLFIITHNEYLSSLIENDATEIKVVKREGVTSFK